MPMTTVASPPIVYPDSDGRPMADNTKQFRWLVILKEGLEAQWSHDPQVFVAGDLLWYPVQGRPKIRVAPDVVVVFGAPRGIGARIGNGRKTASPHRWCLKSSRQAILLQKCAAS